MPREPAALDEARLAAWLDEHQPAESGAALIHNDFKYDNLVLDDDLKVKVVLDWEMATVGDPLLDLGSSLAYWIQTDEPMLHPFAFGPTHADGALTRAEVVERYARQTGREDFDPVWYYAYGQFKLTVVAQQLYLRYVRGLTTEKRYAQMLMAEQLLAAVALQAIKNRRV